MDEYLPLKNTFIQACATSCKPMNLSPQHLGASPSLHQKPERTPLVSLPPLPHPSPPLSLAAPLTPILVVESGLFGLTETATESVPLPAPRWAGGLQLARGGRKGPFTRCSSLPAIGFTTNTQQYLGYNNKAVRERFTDKQDGEGNNCISPVILREGSPKG